MYISINIFKTNLIDNPSKLDGNMKLEIKD